MYIDLKLLDNSAAQGGAMAAFDGGSISLLPYTTIKDNFATGDGAVAIVSRNAQLTYRSFVDRR
jgi:hypothetical protein